MNLIFVILLVLNLFLLVSNLIIGNLALVLINSFGAMFCLYSLNN